MTSDHLQVKVSQKALITSDSKLLLVLEGNDWELPGVRVDQGETNLKEALKRELIEELNISINPISIFTAYLFTKPTGEISLTIVWKCELINPLSTIIARHGEIDSWKLFSKDELINLNNIFPNSKEAIELFLSV